MPRTKSINVAKPIEEVQISNATSEITIEKLMKDIEQLQNLLNQYAKNKDVVESNKSDQLTGDTYIKVMSLCPYPLNLSTAKHGKGKVFSFSEFGKVKRITYRDLMDIYEACGNFAESGYFYIADERVVTSLGLQDFYSNILTKENFEEILNGDEDVAFEIYKSANDVQREFINETLVSKMIKGEEYSKGLVWNIERKFENAKLTEKAKDAMNLFNKEK